MSQIKIKEEEEEEGKNPSIYSKSSNPQHIVILGGGFAGIGVLKKLQKKFQNNSNVEITLVSKDNFILFTPMLPEIVSGMIETRHIVTPVREFCKKAKYFEANIKSIDFDNKTVTISHIIGRYYSEKRQQRDDKYNNNNNNFHEHTLKYDYLVIALGSENNFFGNEDIENNSFTMKSIDDAIALRNHIIRILEQANIEQDNHDLRKTC